MKNVFDYENTENGVMSNARVINNSITIRSVEDLKGTLSKAKAKGQFATLECETPIKLNKFPTDGSEKIRRDDNFCPIKHYKVSFHFGDSTYEKKMSDALGIDYFVDNSNRVHLVKDVLMQYISTGSICFIYLPRSYSQTRIVLDGRDITAEELTYLNRYLPCTKSNIVEYRTVNVKNVKSMTIGKIKYVLDLIDDVAKAA